MSISSKTRKALWARSGNRCAICKIELIEKGSDSKIKLNTGEECHIISRQRKGPRHKKLEKDIYDDYDNLLLLCRNHHKEIDENIVKYTVDKLNNIKNNHEKWIQSKLNHLQSSKLPKVYSLFKITSGTKLFSLIDGIHATSFNNDEVSNAEEALLIGEFYDYVHEIIEHISLDSSNNTEKLQYQIKLDKEINNFESNGFLLFGNTRKVKLKSEKLTSDLVFPILYLMVKRKDNFTEENKEIPMIIKDQIISFN